MKLMYRGELQTERGFGGALAGTRIDEVILSKTDVYRLWMMLSSGSEIQRQHVVEGLNTLLLKFAPGAT